MAAVETLLADLVAALASLYTAPPDENPLQTRQGRLAAYGRLRERGLSRKEAAWHVGVGVETGYRYDQILRERRQAEQGAA